MSTNTRNTRTQTLALAGVAQFALYAHELATQGVLPSIRMQRALQAIFCTDPEAPEDVFNGIAGVIDGRRFLRTQLEGNTGEKQMAQVSRYIGQILRLSASLYRDHERLGEIADGIARARRLDAPQAPAALAQTYQQTISSLSPRVMIRGQQNHLDNPNNAERIRTLLLAAVRCAILWRQSGGSFWRLLLQRKKISEALMQLSQEASPVI